MGARTLRTRTSYEGATALNKVYATLWRLGLSDDVFISEIRLCADRWEDKQDVR